MADYYRKTVNNTADDVKLKMQMAAFTLKLSENNDKIDDLLEVDKNTKKNIADNSNSIKNMKNETDLKLSDKVNKKYIDDILYDKKYIDDNYLIKENTYDKKYIDDNYLIKGNTYDKKYIDDNFFTKRVLNNSFASIYARIDTKDDEVLKEIENNYYNKNELNNNFNNLYNRTYLDNKFDNIYNKTEVNNITSKLKLDKMRYYIAEFINFNITLVRKFTFIGDINEINILQFEMDQREFNINDIIQFFLNITIQYDNSKSNWYRLKLKLDVLYDDETLIKSFIKMPISKGFLYQHLMIYNINRYFKLNKKAEKIIFKIYMSKINTSLQDNIVFNLNQQYENDY